MGDQENAGKKFKSNSDSTPNDKLSSDYKDGHDAGEETRNGTMTRKQLHDAYSAGTPEEKQNFKKGYADGSSTK
ncbi:MAG: hypothetical protein NTW65_10480 [Deltaproteobacteria bacterium]|nr:hypothetical protein [Deltaproteobacteria bacterium]